MWYRWTWTDGLVTICKGYNKAEMRAMVRNHGKLINKQIAY